MALFDNIINKYFKAPESEGFLADDPNVSTKDKTGTTSGSNETEQSGGTVNPYSQVGGGKVDDGNLRFSMPQTQSGTEESPVGDTSVSTKDNAGTTAGSSATTEETSATEQSDSSGVGAYMQLWDRLYGGVYGEPESQEDIEEREKREKRNSTISALGDALGGIANIWGATKGATPMDISSLSEANKKRYDYAKERREKNQEARRRGMYTAGAQDINAQERAEELKQRAEERAAAQKYREEQDKIKEEQWQTKYDFDTEQARKKEELDRQRLEETQKKNEADLQIRKRTVALAERKAEAALIAAGNPTNKGKVVRFGLADGTNVTVPDDLKGSYVADVYNQLVNAAGDATIDRNGNTKNPILSFMRFQYGQKEPGLNEMMTAVQLYASEYGMEEYMIERANEYTENYNTPVVAKDLSAPGSPGESTVPLSENEELPPLTDDDLLEYLDED